MAGENQGQESQPSLITSAYRAVMRDGFIAAAGRQGVDELAQALKAFPDSIQAHAEPGGMFEPLHRDIAAARDNYAPDKGLPSPGEIAHSGERNPAATVHGQQHGPEKPREVSPGDVGPAPKAEDTVHGQARDTAGRDSPGEIANGPAKPQDAHGQARLAKDGWAQRILEDRERTENGGYDPNEQGRERSRPDEQRERDNSRGR